MTDKLNITTSKCDEAVEALMYGGSLRGWRKANKIDDDSWNNWEGTAKDILESINKKVPDILVQFESKLSPFAKYLAQIKAFTTELDDRKNPKKNPNKKNKDDTDEKKQKLPKLPKMPNWS